MVKCTSQAQALGFLRDEVGRCRFCWRGPVLGANPLILRWRRTVADFQGALCGGSGNAQHNARRFKAHSISDGKPSPAGIHPLPQDLPRADLPGAAVAVCAHAARCVHSCRTEQLANSTEHIAAEAVLEYNIGHAQLLAAATRCDAGPSTLLHRSPWHSECREQLFKCIKHTLRHKSHRLRGEVYVQGGDARAVASKPNCKTTSADCEARVKTSWTMFEH